MVMYSRNLGSSQDGAKPSRISRFPAHAIPALLPGDVAEFCPHRFRADSGVFRHVLPVAYFADPERGICRCERPFHLAVSHRTSLRPALSRRPGQFVSTRLHRHHARLCHRASPGLHFGPLRFPRKKPPELLAIFPKA